ncbi:MAG TPA: hypothetical protein VGK02_09445 [Candidatus Aquicultor sp.]
MAIAAKTYRMAYLTTRCALQGYRSRMNGNPISRMRIYYLVTVLTKCLAGMALSAYGERSLFCMGCSPIHGMPYRKPMTRVTKTSFVCMTPATGCEVSFPVNLQPIPLRVRCRFEIKACRMTGTASGRHMFFLVTVNTERHSDTFGITLKPRMTGSIMAIRTGKIAEFRVGLVRHNHPSFDTLPGAVWQPRHLPEGIVLLTSLPWLIGISYVLEK